MVAKTMTQDGMEMEETYQRISQLSSGMSFMLDQSRIKGSVVLAGLLEQPLQSKEPK